MSPDPPKLRLIAAPFHDGRPLHDRGLGPGRIAPTAAAVPAPDAEEPEAARVFAIARELSNAVGDAITAGELPVVLAGDCNSCLGTVAGCAHRRIGVVWLDAHADADVPEDSTSGSLDAMGLAMLLGAGWSGLRSTLPLTPVPGELVLTGGIRDTEPHQVDRLERAGVGMARTAEALGELLPELRRQVDAVYLHVDLDVLDPSHGRANCWAAPGGWSPAEVVGTVRRVCSTFDVVAAALTAYDPTCDPDGAVAAVAGDVLDVLREAQHGAAS